MVEQGGRMIGGSTDTIVNGGEQDERAEKIQSQTGNSGESDVRRTQVQRLTSLTRLTSVQKLSHRQRQDIHFFHQVHFKIHLIELTVEALTTSKKTSFISFIVVSGVKE
jgi:hypothetical protein